MLLKLGFEKWASEMCHMACSNEQFIRQFMKNEMIFAQLAKSLQIVSPLPVIFHHNE